MGYTMRTVVPPDGEATKIDEIRKQFFAAVDARNVTNNVDPVFLFAQERVSQLYDLLTDTEKSSFQLSEWGMGRYCQAMYELGMAFDCDPPGDAPEWPAGRLGLIATAILEQTDPIEYLAGHGKAAPTETELASARAYAEQVKALLRAHPSDVPGIPLFKLGSSDGWVVTPTECVDALAAWYRASDEQRDRALLQADVDDRRYWNEWLDYLHLACLSEGFEIC